MMDVSTKRLKITILNNALLFLIKLNKTAVKSVYLALMTIY